MMLLLMYQLFIDHNTVKPKRRRRTKRPNTTSTMPDLSSDSNTDYEEESELGKENTQRLDLNRAKTVKHNQKLLISFCVFLQENW